MQLTPHASRGSSTWDRPERTGKVEHKADMNMEVFSVVPVFCRDRSGFFPELFHSELPLEDVHCVVAVFYFDFVCFKIVSEAAARFSLWTC